MLRITTQLNRLAARPRALRSVTLQPVPRFFSDAKDAVSGGGKPPVHATLAASDKSPSEGEKKESAVKAAPSKEKFSLKKTWISVKEVLNHYWVGSKLFAKEVRITAQLVARITDGHSLTRRERLQLSRTSQDLVRLVPFVIIVIVPFLEFALPVILKLFPNMLPSTFRDELKEEENRKKELQMRLAVAKFLLEAIPETVSQKRGSTGSKEVLEFIGKARLGEPVTNERILQIARAFNDELTLDNIPRPQLVSMAKYMRISEYGPDAILRFQLRKKINVLKEDDRRILWEGIDALNTLELRDACRERGMRSDGLTLFKLRKQLQEWLDLSIQKNIPISLLIMSRALMLVTSEMEGNSEQLIKNSLTSLDSDTINEIVVSAADNKEKMSTSHNQRMLESIEFQHEKILEERGDVESAKTKSLPDSPLSITADSASPDAKSDIRVHGGSGDSTASVPATGELSINEIEAIRDMASHSSVSREKAELTKLESSLDQEDKAAAKKSVVTVDALLRSAASRMLSRAKISIAESEKLVSNFPVLDKDGDGELSTDELTEAIVKHLRRDMTVEEAKAIAERFDRDQDGKVSLLELRKLVDSRQDAQEVAVLLDLMDKRLKDQGAKERAATPQSTSAPSMKQPPSSTSELK